MQNEFKLKIEFNESVSQEIRDLKSDPQAAEGIAEINAELNEIAEHLVAQVKSAGVTSCPCIVSDLLENFPLDHLHSIIKVEAFMAAIKLHRDDEFHDQLRVITHAVYRCGELEADELLRSETLEN